MDEIPTESRRRALEAIFGSPLGILAQPIPFRAGGQHLDLAYVRDENRRTITVCTHNLTGWESGQQRGPRGQFELVMVVRDPGPLAPDFKGEGLVAKGWVGVVLDAMGQHSCNALLQSGEVAGPLNEAFGSLQSLLFWELTSDRRPFEFDGGSYGLLLCIGITPEERDWAQSNGASKLVELLRTNKTFPLTDPSRDSVV